MEKKMTLYASRTKEDEITVKGEDQFLGGDSSCNTESTEELRKRERGFTNYFHTHQEDGGKLKKRGKIFKFREVDSRNKEKLKTKGGGGGPDFI